MDPTFYKDLTTSRGFRYHYYFSPANPPTNPTLLFVHGFPSTSNDWRHQVIYFKTLGYGVVVPDMLGYGGTDKPTDTASYRHSLICKDLVDILDAEGVHQPIAIGHDWGSWITGRLANLYPERFAAFGFLAVSYYAPTPNFDIQQMLTATKEAVGYEIFGYWKFFSEEGADKLIETHWDSFLSALFPEDPKLWMTDFAPSGALKDYILADKKTARPAWLSEEDLQDISDILLKGGMASPLCWYKVMTSKLVNTDDKAIPTTSYDIHNPVFFGATSRDYICLEAMGKAYTAQYCKGVTTVRDFDTGHWVMLEAKDELNKELGAWIQGLGSS